MDGLRLRSWFASMCLLLAMILATIASTPPDVCAGIVPSHGSSLAYSKDVDLERIQRILERNVVQQKLLDYGVSPQEAMAKVRQLEDKELHLLVTRMEQIPEGGAIVGVDTGGLLLIMLVIVAIAVVATFLALSVKAVITDMIYKPSPEDAPPELVPSPAPSQ